MSNKICLSAIENFEGIYPAVSESVGINKVLINRY